MTEDGKAKAFGVGRGVDMRDYVLEFKG